MRLLGSLCIVVIASTASVASSRTPADPVSKNIRSNCNAQKRCIAQQRAAMRRALNYLAAVRPPEWKLQLCNKNASRGGVRVDWIGFENCIRNPGLRPPAPPKRKKKLHIF